MGLEWRGNNLYYYEKERSGGRVRSVYSGKGELAYLLLQSNLWRKRDEAEEKQRKNNEKEQMMQKEEAIDAEIETVSEIAKLLTDAYFLANGFHQHKRQWRKKRDGKAK